MLPIKHLHIEYLGPTARFRLHRMEHLHSRGEPQPQLPGMSWKMTHMKNLVLNPILYFQSSSISENPNFMECFGVFFTAVTGELLQEL